MGMIIVVFLGKFLPLGDKTKAQKFGAFWHFFHKNPLSPYLDNRFQHMVDTKCCVQK
jgi:hypothetical protein